MMKPKNLRTTMLVGLPGCGTAANIKAFWFFSPKTAVRFLGRPGLPIAATSAGDYGAISIWIDEDERYRGERDVRCIPQSQITCNTKQELLAWLLEEYPKIKEQ
jgi:hypothetical protein